LINKATRVALPVFFRQADACLMTRTSFEVLGELNPQLNKQLRVLAISPELVPAGFAFRADYVSPLRAQMLTEMARLGETPAGQQILALTQAERIVDRPVSCLDNALELLAQHRRLCAATNAGAARRPPVSAESSSQGENP
jgi:phosphonate transport system substrate-binding protein